MTTHEIILPIAMVAILILSCSVHEAAHAWVAYRCGDDTAKRQGRMTLNPIEHIDPFMSILIPIMLYIVSSGSFIFGGARPVPVYSPNLRNPSRDMMFVALAGPISNILQAFLLIIVWKILGAATDYPSSSLLVKALIMGIQLNLILAVFNMIPLPPLDGSRVLRHFLPQQARPMLDQMEQYGIFLLIGLLYFVPGAFGFIHSVTNHLIRFLDTLSGGAW